jgi:hypothetical protein
MHSHDRAIVEGVLFVNSVASAKVMPLPTTTPEFCLGIVTAHRTVPYIQALWASLQNNDDDDDAMAATTEFHIFNTEEHAQDHVALTQLLVQQQPQAHTNHSSSQFVQIHTTTNVGSWEGKESLDYKQALQTCVVSGAPWIILLEEDSLVTRNFLRKTQRVLASSAYARQRRHDDSLLFVKLWYSDRWDGFENDDIPWLCLGCALFGWILSVGVQSLLVRRLMAISSKFEAHKMQKVHTHHSPLPTRRWIFAGCTLMLLLNCLLCGKQNLHRAWHAALPTVSSSYRLRPLGEHHGAGTVAMAYPLEAARRIGSHLDTLHMELAPNIDVILYQLLQKVPAFQNSVALEVSPPLVQHIGAYSSNKKKNQGDFAFMGQNEAFVMT